MAKQLLIVLFKIFIISTIVSIAAICIFYSVSQKSTDYQHVVTLVSSGAMLLNIILFIMALPILFLAIPAIRSNALMKILYYFSGSLAFIVTASFIQLSKYDRIVYLLAGGIFLVIQTIFYFKTVRKID